MTSYQNLLGHQFEWGERDCFSLLRDFYNQEFDIQLPDFGRPRRFWEDGLDLYMDNHYKLGFRPIQLHPTEWQYGDVFLMAIQSQVGNHVAVYVENDMILHHLINRLSVVERYRGMYRNTTLGMFRHKDVKVDREEHEVHIEEYLSPRVRKELDEYKRKVKILPDG